MKVSNESWMNPAYYLKASGELNDLADRLEASIGAKAASELRDRAWQLRQASVVIHALNREIIDKSPDLRDPDTMHETRAHSIRERNGRSGISY